MAAGSILNRAGEPKMEIPVKIYQWQRFAAIALCVAVSCGVSLAQVASPTILYIDTENSVQYREYISDVSKFATNPGVVNADTAPRNFGKGVFIADIVAVNGQPVRGTLVFNTRAITLSPAPNAGEAIADVVRTGVIELLLEILKTDGTPIGSIMALGLAAGVSPPPGAPLATVRANNAIVGGTGAFLGARGQFGNAQTAAAGGSRLASMAEDPANRRRNGGGKSSYVLHVIPMSRPEILSTPTGPAVTHSSDFSPVTASRPARRGEILSLFATGLGPTRPGVDPGQPFPANPLAAVNSPVEVTVNGKPAEVTGAAGFAGSVDGYQVNFRIPADSALGLATIQLSAAWIAGPEVRIAIAAQ